MIESVLAPDSLQERLVPLAPRYWPSAEARDREPHQLLGPLCLCSLCLTPLNKGLPGADEALCGPRADSGGDAMLPLAFLKGIPNKDVGGMCVHKALETGLLVGISSQSLLSLLPPR